MLWRRFESPSLFLMSAASFMVKGFDDYLKQVAVVYLNLDLSQIAIDNTILPTSGGNDAVNDETDDSVHIVEEEVKDPDDEVIIQPAPEGPAAPVVLFIADGPTTANDLVSNAPPS